MYPDVLDLCDFYDTHLGRVTRRLIARKLRELAPDSRGMRVLGLGFATPYLSAMIKDAERVVALMPAGQGVVHWPRDARQSVALTDELDLPLPEAGFDRVLLVHALEHTPEAAAVLREVWRVLTAGGRLFLVVPNRRGAWARSEQTPFGYGRPFTRRQINSLLRQNMFTAERSASALFLPPSRRRLVLRALIGLEGFGQRWWPNFGGVRIIEASKQIYGMTPLPVGKIRRLPAFSGRAPF